MVLYSFESLWASLCPCANTFCVRGVASPRPRLALPGFAQASPSLEALRLQACINIIEGKDCHDHYKKVQEASFLGSFFAPETDMIFGDGVGASLVRGLYCQLDVGLCDVDVFRHWNGAAEEGAWVGLKLDLQGGTGFNLLRVHFWTPVQRKRVSKRGQKVARLKSKVVPPGGSSFGPFLVPSLWQICWGVYFKSKVIWPATAAAGILNWGGQFLRACFFLRFEVQKRAPSFSYCFAPISIALRPSRPASKPALTCFVLISMVVRHWSSRLALRSASNFVSSYNSFGLLQFP